MTTSKLARLTLKGARRVPEVTVYFWVIKALSTAMGESTSDYLVHAMAPELAPPIPRMFGSLVKL